MIVEVKAPQQFPDRSAYKQVIFLAGSIEMGKAEEWRKKVVETISGIHTMNHICLLNPRRDDWDSTWEQSITNDKFREQVEWELEGLERATHIIFYFDPNTTSPITLLELGLYAPTHKSLIVICPDGYFRKGNVDIVCKRYNVPVLDSLDQLLNDIKSYKDEDVKSV